VRLNLHRRGLSLRGNLINVVQRVAPSNNSSGSLAFCLLAATALLLTSFSVLAKERLSWEYTGYEKLATLFDSEPGPLYGERENRRTYQLRFVVQGESLEDWTEILEIMSTWRKHEPENVQLWLDRFKTQGNETCPSNWTTIDEQASSIIFRRTAKNCEGFDDQDALYKVLYGKKKVFLIFATMKGEMDETSRDGYLTVLREAEIRY
jgi:hypothetical protein